MFSALKMIAKDSKTIAYRPEIAALLGSVTAAILLQQIAYWYEITGRAFYKYRLPCDPARAGDSWIEELGFSPAEFDYARKKIAHRIRPGENILLPRSLPPRLDDEPDAAYYKRLQQSDVFASLVVYWMEANHRTYYKINEPLFDAFFALAYPASTDSTNANQEEVADSGNCNQQGDADSTNWNQLIPDSAIRYTENTTETIDTESNQPPPRPHPVVVEESIPKSVKTVFGEKRALGIIEEIKLRHNVITDYHRLDALCQAALDNPAVRNKGGFAIAGVIEGWVAVGTAYMPSVSAVPDYSKWDTPDNPALVGAHRDAPSSDAPPTPEIATGDNPGISDRKSVV